MPDATKVDESFISKMDLGSDFLRSMDLLVDREFKTLHLTIEEFFPVGTLRGADKKVVDKPAISFVGKKKKMILSATSQEVLHLVSGTADGMKTPGTKVIVEARVVAAFGDMCLGLRIMPPSGTLMRKGLRKHLGTKAVWIGGDKPQEEGNPNEQKQNAETPQAESDASQ